MKIRRRSPLTGIVNELDLPVTGEEYDRWLNGELAQTVWPQLTTDQREFIISGCLPGEFEEIFKEVG